MFGKIWELCEWEEERKCDFMKVGNARFRVVPRETNAGSLARSRETSLLLF